MRKKVVESRIIGLAVCTGLIFMSCAFQFQSPSDPGLSNISGELNYNSISRHAFMGGSVIYNPDQLSSGHLSSGAHIAVRFGRVDRDYSAPGESGFVDRADAARYGYITINSIDATRVSFTFTEFTGGGRSSRQSSHSLSLDQAIDITGDGVADLTYVRPTRQRPGMENAVFLTFLSSQDSLTTSMFAALPEQYSRSTYPSGIMGVNPDERFIVTRYERPGSTARSAVQGLVYGDIVIDTNRDRYLRVTGSGNFRNARSISDADVTDTTVSSGDDMYFSVGEFNDALRAENLFNALPVALTSQYSPANVSNATLVPLLNQMLERRDLVVLVAEHQDSGGNS